MRQLHATWQKYMKRLPVPRYVFTREQTMTLLLQIKQFDRDVP